MATTDRATESVTSNVTDSRWHTMGTSWRRIRTIVRKELLVLLENKQSRLMLIVPPLMQMIIFAWAATMEVRHVRVAVLNHDAGVWSHEVVARVRGAPTFSNVYALTTEADIRPTLDGRQAMVVLVFANDFSRRIMRGEPAPIQVILDGRQSNAAQITANYLEKIVQSVSEERGPAVESGSASSLRRLNIQPRFWFNPSLEFQWFFLPNLIGMLSFMLGLIVTGLTVAREREMGTFDQLLVSPATPLEIALAKLAPGCLVGLVHGSIFLFLSHFAFGVPVVGPLSIFYVAMLMFSLAAGGMGLMVSSLASTQQQAFLGAFAVGVPCILISGATTPVENMPIFLQWLTQANPLRHFLNIIQGVFLKDMTLGAVGMALGKITIIATVCVSIAVAMFTRRH